MSIWLFFRIEFGGVKAIGPHKAAMLEAIDQLGTIAAAAPAVDLTYRQFWRVVQLLNTHFNKPLIEIRRSGRSSGAVLTPLGKEVLARFREMQRVANEALEKHFREFEALVGVDPRTPQPVPRFAQVIPPSTSSQTAKRLAKTAKAKTTLSKKMTSVSGSKKKKKSESVR